MGMTCETLGKYYNCIQSFGRKTRRTKTIWKTKTHMEKEANITKYGKRLSGCSATCFGYKCTTLTGHITPSRNNEKVFIDRLLKSVVAPLFKSMACKRHNL
jgi:hypothetical protein